MFARARDQAITAAQRALALAMAGGEIGLQALANQYLGHAYRVQGDYRQAIDCFGQTVASLDGTRHCERFGLATLPSVNSRAYLVACHAELGTFPKGRAIGDEGLWIAEAVAHPGSLMVASWGVGLLALRQGDLSRALPLLERAVGLCQGADLPAWFPLMAAALGAAYTLDGRVADAVPLLMQAMEQITAIETVEGQVQCYLALGEAQLLAGRLEEAHALAERALAEDHYQQALTLAEELGMCPLVAHCHLGLGTLYATIGRQEPARAELSVAIELFHAMEMTFWLPQAEATVAEVEGR